MNEILQSLLLDLTDSSDEEAEELTRAEYIRLYTDKQTRACKRGELKTHDGQTVSFYEDRFDHAFNTSLEGAYSQFKKDKFDRTRAVRVRWIGPVIKGLIDGTEYCSVTAGQRKDRSGRIRVRRVYIVWEQNYMVWLEPTNEGQWKFSSAYVANKGYIRRITRGCYCKKISRD